MKAVSLPLEGLSLEKLLDEAARSEVVYLTAGGQTRFALMSVDEGDEEVAAMRLNDELMAYLAQCSERAQRTPGKSLQEIRKLYGVSLEGQENTAEN